MSESPLIVIHYKLELIIKDELFKNIAINAEN
jgi:hypothetical protein